MPRSSKPKKSTSAKSAMDNGQQKLFLGECSVNKNADTEADFSSQDSEPAKKKTLTVNELTHLLKGIIQQDSVLGRSLTVEGELSNVKQSSRGHIYFTLKDENASINGVLWASIVKKLTFQLEDGQAVFLTGKLDIYAPSGTYSIVATNLEPVGIGSLQLAFEQTKLRLEAEGLFMPEFKKAIPEFPDRIGIITASTGAVIHDMLRVIRKKNPLVSILLYPVKVQGDGAALQIAEAISTLNDPKYRLDTLILGRGGGSFEDLYCFSEEVVVRAVFKSRIPLITGIGHEPDFSLADVTADHSASTPTAAAEACVPDIEAIDEWFALQQQYLEAGLKDALLSGEQTLDLYATQLVQCVEMLTNRAETSLNTTSADLQSCFSLYFQEQSQKMSRLAAELNAFNPVATLARGYAVASLQKAEGDGFGGSPSQIIHSIHQAVAGDMIMLRVADGSLLTEVRGKQVLPET